MVPLGVGQGPLLGSIGETGYGTSVKDFQFCSHYFSELCYAPKNYSKIWLSLFSIPMGLFLRTISSASDNRTLKHILVSVYLLRTSIQCH